MPQSHLGTVFILIAQKAPTFYFTNRIYLVFQVLMCTVKLAKKNLSTGRMCDSNETIKFLDKHNC
jgi:hypothetical protein